MTQVKWDRFDICIAWYEFATNWHGGQGSAEYAVFGRLSRLRFKPACNVGYSPSRLDRDEDANARAILANLIRRERRGEQVARPR